MVYFFIELDILLTSETYCYKRIKLSFHMLFYIWPAGFYFYFNYSLRPFGTIIEMYTELLSSMQSIYTSLVLLG